MRGIDVSHYNGKINFSAIKNVDLAIIKASEGKSFKDNMFKTNYEGFKKAKILVGAYHFLRGNDTALELNNFLQVILKCTLDVGPVIDIETDLGGVTNTSKKVRAFADALIKKGYSPILYTYSYFYEHNLDKTVKNLPLWIANYSAQEIKLQHVGWQYTDSGKVTGITGKVDISEFKNLKISASLKKK